LMMMMILLKPIKTIKKERRESKPTPKRTLKTQPSPQALLPQPSRGK
jgi:hypothetical protein